jgi:hypothetical protein
VILQELHDEAPAVHVTLVWLMGRLNKHDCGGRSRRSLGFDEGDAPHHGCLTRHRSDKAGAFHEVLSDRRVRQRDSLSSNQFTSTTDP